jgi:hypothetical protein
MKTTKSTKPSTVNVRWHGKATPATCDAGGTVRVYDDVADHYTTCHSLTAAQVRYVRSRARAS